MSTLTFTKQMFRGSPPGGDSLLPSLAAVHIGQNEVKARLPEGDPLFPAYGAIRSVYPYAQQNRYSRALADFEADVAILENGRLKAVFLPAYGGRLWQLLDKESGRDLLYRNDVLRPSNLSLRNAWFSGGVEWNCGLIGHHPFTCAPMFTAAYVADGMPVLRMYQWERIRNATYQIDFCLPDGSRFLYARTRIHNPNPETIPMYWWSTTAVPELEGSRVAVPADETYMLDAGFLTRKAFPALGGADVSFPMDTVNQNDYFYFLPDEARKYEGYVHADGTGMIQASTSRLQGRKLFVWGQQPGSGTWQRFLTEGAGPYVEIQAGLGRTQYGCVPMQPYGTWEFAEVYGPMAIDPELQAADYPTFRSAVEKALDSALPERQLEDWLASTVDSMGRNYVPAASCGGGDAALEDMLRAATGRRALNAGLDFGKPCQAHEDFVHLLAYGYMPGRGKDYLPGSFVSGTYWRKLLETAANGPDRDNWLTWYHLGLVLMDDIHRATPLGQPIAYRGALPALRRAADLCANGPVLYALAEALASCGEDGEAAACAVKSCRLFGGELSVAKDALRILVSLRAYGFALALYDELPVEVRADGRVEFWRASALVGLGRCDEALAILRRPGYMVDDIRESEQSVNALWGEIVLRTGGEAPELPDSLNFSTKT